MTTGIANFQPQALAVTVNGFASVTLTWTLNKSALVANYAVYRNGVQIATVPQGTATYTDTTVLKGTHYSYAVASLDAGGNASPQTPMQRAEVLQAANLYFEISWVEQPGMAGRPDTEWTWM